MNEWTRAQEADFQSLIHRASEQSRECYLRRKDTPPETPRHEAPKHEPPPPILYRAELPRVVHSTPPPAPPVQVHKVRSEKRETKQAVQSTSRIGSQTGTKGSPLGGIKMLTDKLDNEGMMLAMLLWLLIEEKADNSIILAIAYILLV